MHQTLTINSGQRLEFFEVGDFFRLMNAVGPVTIEFYRNGKEIAEAMNVGAGYGERFYAESFDRFAITSSTTQQIQIASRLGGEIWYDTPPVGQVSVVNTGGAFTHSQVTVTSTSTQIDAASARRYLLIQNNDQLGEIYVRMDGAGATIGTGIKIEAGGSYEQQGYVTNGAITAIGNIASNSNILIVKG